MVSIAAKRTVKQQLSGKGVTAKAKLKVVFDSFVERTWYYAQKRTFYYRDPVTDEFRPANKDDLREILMVGGFFNKVSATVGEGQNGHAPLSASAKEKREKKAEKNSWFAFLEKVRSAKQVTWAGEIAGYQKGEIRQGNKRALILEGPKLVKGKKGRCPFHRALLQQLLGDFFPYLALWLKRGYQSIQEQKHSFGHVLILVGPPSIGKSLVQHGIITPFFGGRSADAFRSLSGDTPFNGALAAAEHGFVDDPARSRNFSRRTLEEGLKRFSSKSTERVESKGKEAIDANLLLQRLSISLNDEPHCLSILPTPRSDLADKLLLAGCRPAEILADLTEPEIREKLEEERAAFVDWVLNEGEPIGLVTSEDPAEKRTIKRFGFKSYLDPEILEAINRESPSETLRRLIHASSAPGENKSGYPAVLHSELCGHPLYGPSIKTLAGTVNYFGMLIAELSKTYPEEFQILPTRTGRTYQLHTPEKD